jgi:hypothetical protein
MKDAVRREPYWLDAIDALAIHDRQLAEHGGGSGLPDSTMLESALARPQNQWHYGRPTSLHVPLPMRSVLRAITCLWMATSALLGCWRDCSCRLTPKNWPSRRTPWRQATSPKRNAPTGSDPLVSA